MALGDVNNTLIDVLPIENCFLHLCDAVHPLSNFKLRGAVKDHLEVLKGKREAVELFLLVQPLELGPENRDKPLRVITSEVFEVDKPKVGEDEKVLLELRGEEGLFPDLHIARLACIFEGLLVGRKHLFGGTGLLQVYVVVLSFFKFEGTQVDYLEHLSCLPVFKLRNVKHYVHTSVGVKQDI